MTHSIFKPNTRQWAEQKLRLAEDAWLLQSSEHMAHFYARDIAALAAGTSRTKRDKCTATELSNV